MAKTVYVNVPLTQKPPTTFEVNFVAAATGNAVSAPYLVTPKSGNFVPPVTAVTAEILTPGAYFFPPGETVQSERTLQQRDQIVALLDLSISTLGVYSFDADNVLVRCHYE